MKWRRYVLLPLLIATAVAADMQKHLTETKALIREKKYPEALQRISWFYEHVLEHDPSMDGVRNSFALGYWKDLCDVYPPAMKALVKLRETKADLVRSGKGSPEVAMDLAAIEKTLRE
jgi:hypothetical protein